MSCVQRAGAKAEPWESTPLGMAHTPVPTDILLPPLKPVTVIKEHFTSQPLGNTKGGKVQEEQGLCYFKGFRGPGSLRKGENKFPVFQAQQEGEMTALLSVYPLEASLVPGYGGWGPRILRGGSAGHKQLLTGKPRCPGSIVTFSRGQHAVHAVGGRCELREGWVPAFQDVGSVNIPAIRKGESGLLRTVHLSLWPRCPVSILDLDRPENEVSV